MYKNKYTSAVVVAAGSGSRMKSTTNKPFIKIKDKMILQITLERLDKIKEIDEIIIVVRDCDIKDAKKCAENLTKRYKITIGGKTREESTYNGIKEVNSNAKLIMTHDSVRPFFTEETIRQLFRKSDEYKAVISAVNVVDTVKVIKEDFTVSNTPVRKNLYNVQTPQLFDAEMLKTLYEKYLKDEHTITDDSSLFENANEKVKVVPGDYRNIKITSPIDRLLANEIMENL